jgi:hypothetical protein
MIRQVDSQIALNELAEKIRLAPNWLDDGRSLQGAIDPRDAVPRGPSAT